jgi:hypothetical protein
MSSRAKKELEDAMKQGMVISSDWQAYTWKNELAEQRDRISQCLEEILSEADTEHNPLHMIERSVGVAALCMRRLLECRLVTDRFRDGQLEVHWVHRKADSPWREPFISRTAGEIFQNYDLTGRERHKERPKRIADKILHARVIAVINGSSYLPNGLLVASDTQRKEHIFHFTPAEFSELLKKFLDDFVGFQSDGFATKDGKICTDKVVAKRD